MAFRFPWNTNINESHIFLSYENHRNNLGDILNPIIAAHFGSKEVKRISKRFEHYFMIRSIHQQAPKKHHNFNVCK